MGSRHIYAYLTTIKTTIETEIVTFTCLFVNLELFHRYFKQLPRVETFGVTLVRYVWVREECKHKTLC